MDLHEIELKALLTSDQHSNLLNELPKTMTLINEGSIHTTRYRPKDIRLRYSDKTCELVFKDGDPTTLSRKEITIPLSSKEQLDSFSLLLDELGFKADPSWMKHKQEFKINFNGYDYVVCLQDIENFAKILEVEYMADNSKDQKVHEPNMRKIIMNLGLEPINAEEFKEKINDYIKKFG